MKLRAYAEFVGVSYKTAWRWWKQGAIHGEKLPSGTILVTEDVSKSPGCEEIVVVYARVSENREPTKPGQSGRAARRLL
jgi:predicted site-specific integrase-resolvase